MPTIIRLGNVVIRMFADDHNPPHVHIVTPEHQALVSLDRMHVIAGQIDRRSLRTATDWMAGHRDRLNEIWERLNER